MDSSVTQWIAGLKAGDADAVRRLWERYAARLVQLAEQRLGPAPRRVSDEEDLALSVFRSLCHGAAAGRFAELSSRDKLWWLLLAITRQKAVSRIRSETAQMRGRGQVVGETELRNPSNGRSDFQLDELVGTEPTPDFLAMLHEEQERLLGLLRNAQLREIATRRIEGYTVSEIADRLGIAVRSVERKLNLIRSQWAKELQP